MMTKECTCKNGKKDPKCKKCNDINLDSFHRLNPEADPRKKTAEQFKISFQMSPGMTRAMQIGGAGLKGALPGALTGAALGYLSAPEGQGAAGAARGAMWGGLGTGAAAAAHHGFMTGTSGLAKDYQGTVQDLRHGKAVQDRAQNIEYIRQRNANAGTPPPPAPPPPPAEAPKAAMYYEFGKKAALASFDLW